MISCIICSKDKNLLKAVTSNIQQTIGAEYEIVGIDNADGKMGICEAYNTGIQRAKYSYLVFVHEDVVFHTNNWGQVVIKYFQQDASIGCIGVAGGRYKTKAPSHWRPLVPEFDPYDYSYLIQHYKNGTKNEVDTWPDKTKKNAPAVFLDGVFLAMSKQSDLMFDGSMEGFHGYDISICLEAIKKGLTNYVTREILLEHLSGGSFNDKWVKAIHQFHLRNGNNLPLSVDGIKTTDEKLETSVWKRFVELALINRQYRIAFYWWRRLFMIKPFLKTHIYFGKVLLSNLVHKPAMN